MIETENVLVIGGGPAGLAASIYLARANLNPLVIAGSPPGGQLTLTSDVENYPGYESILGPELIAKMRNQALKLGTRFVDQNVLKVNFSDKSHMTHVTNMTYSSKAVIITTGAKALWLNLPSEQRLRGKGVSACATCDGFFFKGKTVAVAGGGDTAMEEALTLTKFAEKVYVIHRRGEFRASKVMQERVLKHPKIEVLFNTVIEEVLGGNRVEGVLLRSLKEGKGMEASMEKRNGKLAENTILQTKLPNKLPNPRPSSSFEVKLDGLFIAIGHKPDTDVFQNSVELDSKGYVVTTARYALDKAKWEVRNVKQHIPYLTSKFDLEYQSTTSIQGIFAAGDCVDYVYRQAATAVGMGVGAALDAERWLESVEIS